jgi:hypothetical protein
MQALTATSGLFLFIATLNRSDAVLRHPLQLYCCGKTASCGTFFSTLKSFAVFVVTLQCNGGVSQ